MTEQKNVILSLKYPQFADALRQRGYHVISSETLDRLIPYERDHADMQCAIVDDTAFVEQSCERLAAALSGRYRVILTTHELQAAYPLNVALNCAAVGKNVIAREDAMEPKLREYCINHGYRIIPVRQGYAKCSCAVVNNHAVITADRSIYYSLKEEKIDVLLIGQGRVKLEGAEYGFIGGASGLDCSCGKRILYFSGDINRHPDAQQITEFCAQHQTEIICLSQDELTDIGGMIFC